MIPFLGSLVIRALRLSLRVEHVHAERIMSLPQCIIAFWHCHLLLMLHSKHQYPAMVMISQSRDGELIAGTFKYFGVDAARGSTTRGSTGALREMIRAAKTGSTIVFTPDGPKGPARIAKDGVIFTAQATGLPIVPVAFAAKKKSYCIHGTGWSCHTRSRARCSSMASRSSCRATATSRNGG